MKTNGLGRLVEACWTAIPSHFPKVKLDAYIFMPNHLHGIVVIQETEEGTACRAPTSSSGPDGLQSGPDARDPGVHFAPFVHDGLTREAFSRPVAGSLSTIVRSLKSAVTKRARGLGLSNSAAIWQRNYYEHVIRNSAALDEIRRYIADNPMRWQEDPENPRFGK